MSFYVSKLIFFSKSSLSSNVEAYKNLKTVLKKNNIVIKRSDKDSSVAVMNRSDNLENLEEMVGECVKKGTYKKREDKILQ